MEDIFREFPNQGWDEESQLMLLITWLDQTPENQRTNSSFREYLEHQADWENQFSIEK